MEIDVGGDEPATVRTGLGYTYNVSPMFYDAMGGEGIRGLDGKLGRDALPLLRSAIEKMAGNPEKYRAMNPENGWGNYDGALRLLRDLLEWCESAPLATLVVS